MAYDPTIRGSSAASTAGSTNGVLNKPTGTVDNDLIIVTGIVNGAGQINAPDNNWHRINSIVSGYQAFWKRASGEPTSWTFTWDGANRAFILNGFSIYSAAGGTISLDTATTSVDPSNTQKTSDAVTPSANALVLISYELFFARNPTGPNGLTLIEQGGTPGITLGYWAGYTYIASGTSSGTFTATHTGDGNLYWGSGTFSLISSITNPASPPFIDDEVVYAPAMAQPFHPPFIDDEVVFAPNLGIGAMHTTTSNSEVALQLSSAGTNLRITEQNSEVATQVSLLGVAQLRATQVTAEVALQVLPPIGSVDFEIQTPSRQLDPAQIGITKRIYVDVDTNRSGPTWGTKADILFPTLVLDGTLEISMPAITSDGRRVIEIAYQIKSRLIALRLANPQLRSRVEVFGIHWDNPIGRGPGES